MENIENNKPETLYLKWLDPRDNRYREAGVAFYNEEYGEYLLKVDEDCGKQFYLKAIGNDSDVTQYRLEMVLKKKDGTFHKRQCVGDGYNDKNTNGDIHIQYGSKFATLVLCLK